MCQQSTSTVSVVLTRFVLLALYIGSARSSNSDANTQLSPDIAPEIPIQSRYVGHCKTAFIRMWPGNSRRFWSYGYVTLKEPYLAGCSMHYAYDTRVYPRDLMVKFGYRVRGVFYGVADTGSANCSGTDYVKLNDTQGFVKYYCGPKSTIDWFTANDYFEFDFETMANSTRARGFHVTIESVRLCGGTYVYGAVSYTGHIQSPMLPDNYPNNAACTFYFSTPYTEEAVISFDCDIFGVETETDFGNGTTLCMDYMSFTYEIPNSESATYCGTSLNEFKHTVWSLKHDLVVYFRTNQKLNHAGFNCTYQFYLFADRK